MQRNADNLKVQSSFSNSGIEGVFFDLGDTLVHLRNEIWLLAICLLFGGRKTDIDHPWYQMLANRLKCVHQTHLRRMDGCKAHQVRTEKEEFLFWEEYYSTVIYEFVPTIHTSRLKTCTTYLAKCTIDAEYFTCFPDVISTLKSLASLGVKLAIISNAHPSAKRIISHTFRNDWFDCILLSYEFGHSKPYPEIYQECLRVTDIAASRALYVDDRASFLTFNTNLPIKPALIDRGYAHLEQWHGRRLSSLSEIATLITHDTLRTPIKT